MEFSASSTDALNALERAKPPHLASLLIIPACNNPSLASSHSFARIAPAPQFYPPCSLPGVSYGVHSQETTRASILSSTSNARSPSATRSDSVSIPPRDSSPHHVAALVYYHNGIHAWSHTRLGIVYADTVTRCTPMITHTLYQEVSVS